MSWDRITTRDVRYAFACHVDALERYGIAYDGKLGLDVGSPTYGRAWRIYRMPTGTRAHHDPPIGSDYLGATAREAHASLTTRTRALHDMAAAVGLPRHETTQDRVNASLEAEHALRQACVGRGDG